MVEDSQYHSRISVVEAEIRHLKDQHSRSFQELKEIITEARTLYNKDKDIANTQRWQMMLAFYVAGLGFIANALVNIIKDLTSTPG